MVNIIVIWSGEIADIPAGWALCDGNNGTPDLRDHIVGGAGLTWAVNECTQMNVAPGGGLCLKALAFIMKVP